jgi:hypothetical protein
MNIQLKRVHLLFCISYIDNLDSNKNFRLLEQVNSLIGEWDGIEPTAGQEVVALAIKGEVLATAWHLMSQQQEGKTATVAREMSLGSEGFEGLESQLTKLAMSGDPDALVVVKKIQFLSENYAQQRADQIAANISYLKILFT